MSGIESFLERHEKRIVLILALLAVSRVLFYSASFPFFVNTDEDAHFDTVVKYSHGYLPGREADRFDRESIRYIVLFRSPEYSEPDYVGRPLWKSTAEARKARFEKAGPYLAKRRNYEAFQPPLYYWVSGGWYRLGKAFGLDGGKLLYWVRALNGAFFGILFGVAYLFCRDFLADRLSVRMSVLSLLAVFPQDLFYSINNDVLSAPLFLLALYLMLSICVKEKSARFHAGTGIAVAAAFLAKMTNSPILIVAFTLFLFALWQSSRAGRLRERLPKLAVLSATVAIPVLAWLGWNAWMVGDVTGHSRVAGDWARKPFLEMFDHPLFTIEGVSFFVRELVTSYWRGEFFWKNQRLSSPGIDLFFIASTIVFLSAAMIRIVGFSGLDDTKRRLMDRSAAISLALGVASLVFVSIGYDFKHWAYPSRESPFLWSGRLISGSLVPFLLLYCSGLEFLLSRWAHRGLTLAVIGGIAVALLGLEIALSWPVFSSPYNWFHL